MSSLHSKVEPDLDDVKVNDGGPPVIVVSGATVSTVNESVAGVGSVPPGPIARTENVYAPLTVIVYLCDGLQAS